MIALQSLKYKIFEWCLETFLDKILNNFNNIPNILINSDGTIDVKSLKEGMFISEIRGISERSLKEGENDISYIWLNCKIGQIIQYNPDDKYSPIHIEWTYSTCLKNGSIIQENKDVKYMAWVYDIYYNTPVSTYIEFYI